VWDGLSDGPIERGFVCVDDGRIESVGRAAELPSDAQARYLGDVTLMPGLINAHVHVTFSGSMDVLADHLRERAAGFDVLMQRARDNLERSVRVGVTTVRDLGTLNDVVFAARADVREGKLIGSDVIAAGEGITCNGGHCYFFGIEAEGEDPLRAAVRRQHEAGADVIKVFATGGNLTPNTDPFSPQFSESELRAVVETANAVGLPVASHAHAPEGIRRSVAAHVDTIEHCMFETPEGIEFDERAVAAMADGGIKVVPTHGASVLRFLAEPELIETLPEHRRPIVRRISSRITEALNNFRRMRDMGVTLVAGTDAGIPNRPFDGFPGDLVALAGDDPGVGLGPREALIAATSGAAQAIGLDDRGRLKPGTRADLLAVAGDPLGRIEDLQATRFVMCAGRVVVDQAT